MPAGSYFFKALLAFLAQFSYPFGGTLFQFRVVFVLPGHQFVECFELAQTHQLTFGRLGQKAAALPGADHGIDVSDELFRQNHVCPFVHELGPHVG